MKIKSYASTYQPLNNSRKNVSFGDDCGGELFTYEHAMKKLREQKYVVKGSTTQDAFGTLYDDVNNVFRVVRLADEQKMKKSFFSIHTEHEVVNWDLPRDKFVETMTKFWENCKNEVSKIKETGPQLEELLEHFMKNIDKTKKLGFWESILTNTNDYYYDKMGAIRTVFENFLKTGLHKLK